MKESLSRMCRSGLAMLLAVCMVFGMVPFGALAASTPTPGVSGVKDVNNDGIITYVSFGDSVTNGYGMDGYRFEDGTNVLGFRQEVPAAYPALIRDYLTEQGFKVNLEQMAISGFRMDELHWMLCDCYEADSFHDSHFANWNHIAARRLLESSNEEAKVLAAEIRNKYQPIYGSDENMIANADAIIMSEYRDAVKNADLITIDLGTNNFGTFVTNTIQEILGLKKLDYTIDFTQYLDANSAASLEAMLSQMVAGMVGASSGPSYNLAMTLARCLTFGYLGFTENYDGAIEAIYELNPDAKVVVIDCYTMITGVELEGGALGENIDLDALYDMFIDLANFYSRELSPYANKVTHATLESAPELFIDYYADYPNANYPDSQYMHPSAERLMNEFVMENMGYDPDEPAERKKFNETILAPIQLLDGYVNNLQATVKAEVIDKQILPGITSGVKTAVDQVDTAITAIDLIYTAVEGVAAAENNLSTAIEGVAAAESAVDTAVAGVTAAEEAVDTAVSGVALAQNIVDMLRTNLIEHPTYGGMFKGSSTSSMLKGIIVSKIEEQISDELMVQAGFEPTSENRSALATEAYYMACVYYDELHSGGTKESATRLAVLECIRYMLVTAKGYSDDEAKATAQTAWELNAINEKDGRDAAVKTALMSKVDESTAEQALALNDICDSKGKDAAVKAAMASQVGEETAETAFAINQAYKSALAAGKSEAEAKQAGVIAAVAASLTEDNMAALASFGITDKNTAAQLIYQVAKLYEANYNPETDASDKNAVVTCLVTLAGNLGITGITNETASTGYDLYAGVYAPALKAGKTETEARELAYITAIHAAGYTLDGTDTLAKAMYAVYCGNATTEQEQMVFIPAMVSAGIDQTVAAAIYACYANKLDGQFNNENVKTVMTFFMTQAMGMTADEAAANYNSYLTYKNLPTTLSKIAKVDTIYFDALLSATAGGTLDLGAIGQEFMAGRLKLDKPTVSEAEDPAAWAEYKSDSALATLFFRFMSQDGIYTHPSEAGQMTLFNAAKGVLNSLLTAEADEDLILTEDTKLLILGDFIAAAEGSYASQIADKLGMDTTNLSRADYRINDVRALLDETYARDEYAEAVTASETADYQAAVKNSDVILVNLGSMNMGMIAKQLAMYMSQETAGQTYSMEFSDLDNMQTQNLGKTMDDFLANFSGSFGADQVGALMLAFETYGYGYTTFADCLDNTIETIQAQNPEAHIVLIGMYDLLGDAYIRDNSTGMHLEMGHFIGHAVKLMNQHMMTYAEMTDNVTYLDVTDIETNVLGKVNMMDGGISGIASAFGSATPTTAGYASMTQKIICHIGAHAPVNADSITWKWNDDFTANASFACTECRSDVTVPARISSDITPATCETEGKAIHTASFMGYTCEETATEVLPITGHAYTVAWEWAQDYSSAVANLTCDNNKAHVKAVNATITVETTDAACEAGGKSVYTATAVHDGKTYTDVKEAPIPATGHNYNAVVTAPTCTEGGYTTYTCAACGHSYVGDKVAAAGHTKVTDKAVAATCTKTGLTEGSHCSVCSTVIVAQESTPATGHSWNNGTVVKEATVKETGIKRYTCTACGETKDETIPVLKPTKVSTTRVSGDDRYKTSLAAADSLKKALGVKSFQTIIVASGENFADALTGSYLAAVKKAPILLNSDSAMEDNVVYITKNLAKGGTVYILGGTNSVSESIEQMLGFVGVKVVRLAGEDRFETNLKILEEAGVGEKDILVCTAYNFADSLSASAVGLPILLVNNKTQALTKTQSEFLDKLDGNDITIIGGINSVSDKLKDTLADYGTVSRVAGAVREETSVLVAKAFFKDPDHLILADSKNYPDGLCGGPLAYALKAPLLLTSSGTEKVTAEYVQEQSLKKATILGGINSVSDTTVKIVFDLN